MSGSRDLAAWDIWEDSLERSRERRRRGAQRRPTASTSPRRGEPEHARSPEDVVRRARDLAQGDPWELSLGRSRARRRALELQFVPGSTRAKRLSLGALAAITAGPAAGGLADAATAAPGSTGAATTTSHNLTLRPGSKGAGVRALQRSLGIAVDGVYGPQTSHAVRAFQARHGLAVDDLVGPRTSAALDGGGATRRTSHGTAPPSGSAVTRLQRALGVAADGRFGPQTRHAVRSFQAKHGLTVDDIVGPATWQALGLSGEGTLHPPGAAGGKLTTRVHARSGGPSTLGVVQRVISGGNRIASLPYRFGGGHGSFMDSGYDCSGSVSYALHAGGLLQSPQDSSGLESYGQPGPGKHITIYANPGHAFMVVDGKRFDTSGQSSSGSRWQPATRDTSGYVVRHPVGL